ncbi:MAG: Uma2 family endonuclease [Frankiales bacterium]|jgi:Uma2 family endonuclease|nr:Uma2 family endonuclease [Frankiales bacterium]
MTTVTTMPLHGDWTVDDLDALPDDGLRYELVDGVLLVSPSPLLPHQVGQSNLMVALATAAPHAFRVLGAPLDIGLSPTRQLQPDVVVIPRGPLTPKVQDLPLLVVEVLSPSTRATDLTLKRYVLEQAGVPSYWLLDPEVPSLTVLELRDGAYVEVARAEGQQPLTVQRPFPVTLVPAELVA